MGIPAKICTLLLCITFFSFCAQAESKRVVCYFGGWTVYRPDDGKFEIEFIDPFLCTHLMYAFVGLGDNSKIRVLDPWQDLPDNWGKDGFGRFNKLKEKNPHLKTLVAIGGWNEGSEKYSRLLRSPANRKIFVDDAVDFVKKYGFDGLDLDWEYPNQRGGEPIDVQTFTSLCKELRAEFDKHGFLVTAAVAAAESSFSLSYNIPEISQSLHFINVMTYDFHGAWEKFTGLNAPLHMSEIEANTNFSGWNVEGSIDAWKKYGGLPEKLVVGIPTYGRAFTLESTNCIKPRCPAPTAGTAGQWTREPGMLGFNEICLRESQAGSQQFFDEEAMVPYLVNDRQWVGYDNERSVKLKTDFIKKNNLGGAMVWSIDTDDFRGSCRRGKYPLISIMRDELIGELPPPPSTTECSGCEPTTTKSTTTSTTTVGPTPAPDEICEHEGYNRDKHDCAVFYLCVIENQKWSYWRFQCGEGLYFDKDKNICNFKELVECDADF